MVYLVLKSNIDENYTSYYLIEVVTKADRQYDQLICHFSG
jgi:hypothetical protein